MSLKLMYITNDPVVAKIAENAGVDRIFIDMEYIGKEDRQGGLDTVKSHHTFSDIEKISSVLQKAELLVRVNPIHEALSDYPSSREEVDLAIKNGADIIMLPYFKCAEELERAIEYTGGRARVSALVETPEAVSDIDRILALDGLDEIHVGLNDLSLGYKKSFMFELLTDGTVERLAAKFNEKNIPFGFGGIAAIGKGMLPAERIITEHYRLGSQCAILSRTFCNCEKIGDPSLIEKTFNEGVREIREFESTIKNDEKTFLINLNNIKTAVDKILESKQ